MLKKLISAIVLIISAATASAEIEIYFSPNGGCAAAIVAAINNATNTVRVQAYELTSRPIAAALIAAKHRGVDVRVILDKRQTSDSNIYDAKRFLRQDKIYMQIDKAHGIAHNKVIIIDNAKVITGSFNFTQAAETRNAENILIITDATIAAKYTTNWQTHANHSVNYYTVQNNGPTQ